MDLNAFECPICLSLFEGPIFQCNNGHVVCDACRIHIHGTCPSCREPVGNIRCRGLENAIASMTLPCSFRSLGCTQLLKHTERRVHEKFFCQHAPLSCPFHRCAYSGQLLYGHIQDTHTLFMDYVNFDGSMWRVSLHRSSPFKVLLDPVDRRVFLLLNGRDVRSGGSLSVVCLSPRREANQLLEYKLEVGGAGPPCTLSLLASGSVPCMRNWAGQHGTNGFLFVPDAYWSSFNFVDVKVHIQKSTVNNALGTTFSWAEVNSSCRLRHPSLETVYLILVQRFFVLSATMALMVALTWKITRRALGE